MYELIIFDCDGVLVDSERLSAEVFSAALQKRNIIMSPSACFDAFKGRTLADCYRLIEQQSNAKLPPDFDVLLADETRHAFKSKLKPVSDVQGLIKAIIAQGIAICVASNGDRKKIKYALGLTQLDVYFGQNVFSAQDVQKGKPAPDLFLYAAQKMQVAPSKCCVIEDSVAGLEAAVKASMDVIYFDQDSYSGHSALSNSLGHIKRATTMKGAAQLLFGSNRPHL